MIVRSCESPCPVFSNDPKIIEIGGDRNKFESSLSLAQGHVAFGYVTTFNCWVLVKSGQICTPVNPILTKLNISDN